MRHLFRLLRNRMTGGSDKPQFAAARPQDVQVVVPEAVVLPLPKSQRDEISIPASINGRDLSTGRL